MTIERKKQRLAGREPFSGDEEKRWSEISSKLPGNLSQQDQDFVEEYFRAQVMIAQGLKEEARRIFEELEKRGFRKFEDKYPGLLAAVDLAVRGSTNRRDKPLFTLSKDDPV